MKIENVKDYETTDQILIDLLYNPIKKSSTNFNEEDVKFLITCIHAEQNNGWNNEGWENMKKELFTLPIMENRLTLFDYELERSVMIFITYICNNNPGSVIMYLTYLQIYAKQNSVSVIDMDKFARAFSVGYPSPQDLQVVWDACKVEYIASNNATYYGNLVDVVSPYKSSKRT